VLCTVVLLHQRELQKNLKRMHERQATM
jgi:hypothetical protein